MVGIGRRPFIGWLAAAAAWPVAARAQVSPRRPLVAWLSGGAQAASSGFVDAFLQGMRDQGYIEGRDVDRYGRLVARVSVRGEDASTALLTAGLACHYVKYSSDVTLANAEAEARRHGRGFWGRGADKPRCTTMALQATEPKGTGGGPVIFHGNTSSRVYHSPSCRNYKCRNCTQAFHSEADARAAGFSPAGDCLSKSSQAR